MILVPRSDTVPASFLKSGDEEEEGGEASQQPVCTEREREREKLKLLLSVAQTKAWKGLRPKT